MKTSFLLCLVVLLCALAFVMASDDDKKPKNPPKENENGELPEYGDFEEPDEFSECPRELNYSLTNGNRKLRVTGKKKCPGRDKNIKSEELKWYIDVNHLPRTTFSTHEKSSQGGSQDGPGGNQSKFQSQFAITKIIEYEETNGQDGYQSGDKVHKVHELRSNHRKGNWTPLKFNMPTPKEGKNTGSKKRSVSGVASTAADDDKKNKVPLKEKPAAKVLVASTRLRRDNNTQLADVQQIWKWTQTTVKDINSTTSDTMVMPPNQVKYNFRMTNITYSSPQVTGLAFEIILVNKEKSGGFKTKTKADVESESGEQRADEPGEKNHVLNLPGEDGSDQGSISFRLEAFVNGSKIIKMHNGTFGEKSNVDGNIEKKSGHKSYRTIYSISSRVNNFDWDPSLGSTSAAELLTSALDSAAGPVQMSFVVVVACIVAFFSVL